MFHQIGSHHFTHKAVSAVDPRNKGIVKRGEIFEGTVIKQYPTGESLLSARGKQFLAYPGCQLMEGTSYRFQVKSSRPKVELRVLDGMSRKSLRLTAHGSSGRLARDKMVSLLSDLPSGMDLKRLGPETRETLRHLSGLLPAIIFKNPEKDTALWLSRNLTGSGLFWENKVLRYLLGGRAGPWKRLTLTDLKGLLLSLDRTIKGEGADGETTQSLITKIEQMLTFLEKQQFLNLSSLQEEVGWYWFIPGQTHQGFRQAEIIMNPDEEDGGMHLSMVLEFSHLGRMEVSLSLIRNTATVRILMETEEMTRLVGDHLPLLETGLERSGFSLGSLTCDVKDEHESDSDFFHNRSGALSPIHMII